MYLLIKRAGLSSPPRTAEDFAAGVEFLVVALRQSQTLRDAVASMGRLNAILPEHGIAIAAVSDVHGEHITAELGA